MVNVSKPSQAVLHPAPGKQSRRAKLARLTILDYVLRHCSFLDKKVLPSVLVSVFFSGFLTNAIWIRIETSTLATTVATVGKSGNLPVASFEYTFDYVANVDEDDNVDDVGENDDDDDISVRFVLMTLVRMKMEMMMLMIM